MRALICLSLVLVLPLAACAGPGAWTKDGVAPAKTAQDLADCRHVAEEALSRDVNIDTDIIASRGPDWERLNALGLKRLDYEASNNARSGDIVERCMSGKGYTRDG